MIKHTMVQKKGKTYLEPEDSNFKRGLDFQRELFKRGKNGTGDNNFDMMCDAIENIKSETKSRLFSAGYGKVVKRVENIINWYRNRESLYAKRTEEGMVTMYPSNIKFLINHNLTVAYELLIKYLDKLGLL